MCCFLVLDVILFSPIVPENIFSLVDLPLENIYIFTRSRVETKLHLSPKNPNKYSILLCLFLFFFIIPPYTTLKVVSDVPCRKRLTYELMSNPAPK